MASRFDRVTARAQAAAARARRSAGVAALIAAALDEGMCVVRATLAPRDVVYLSSILEATEGVAHLLAEHGGELALVCDPTTLPILLALLADLGREFALEVQVEPAAPGRAPSAPRAAQGVCRA